MLGQKKVTEKLRQTIYYALISGHKIVQLDIDSSSLSMETKQETEVPKKGWVPTSILGLFYKVKTTLIYF